MKGKRTMESEWRYLGYNVDKGRTQVTRNRPCNGTPVVYVPASLWQADEVIRWCYLAKVGSEYLPEGCSSVRPLWYVRKSGEIVESDRMALNAKTFSTGSRGYFAADKITDVQGKRYQVQVTMVEIGSKPAVK